MSATAVLAVERFAVARHLSAHAGVFADDLQRLSAPDFVPYPEPALYRGDWRICMLRLDWQPLPPELEVERNQQRCPASHRLLAAMPEVSMAGFSRLLPGCRVLPHQDRPRRGVLRLHLCLRHGDDAVLVVGDRQVALRDGRALVFDHSLEHAAEHHGPAPRDALIVDFLPSPAEVEALRRERGGVNLGPTSAPDCA